MSQCDIQEYVANRSFETDNHSLGVFAAFRTVLGGVEYGRVHAKIESLIVERCDCIANHLISQFADGLANQVI